MRNFNSKFFILIIILAGYAGYFSFIPLDEEKFGVVEDLRINRIVRIFYEKKNFIWQGSFHWWFSIYELPLKKSVDYELMFPVHGLDGIKGEQYLVKALSNFTYRINKEKFTSYEKLGKNNSELEVDIKHTIRFLMNDELNRYFMPLYKGYLVNNDKEGITAGIFNKLKSKFDGMGLDILTFEISGRISVPDMRTYDEGTRHLARIREIEKRNEMQVKALENKISQDKIIDKQKYDKLNEISRIIKDNPDILKYMYIDKMSDNVKIIISSDKSAFPLFLEDKKVLEDKKKDKGPVKEGDITNVD